MSALTDTHCHLDFEPFDTDRPAVVERARQAGVRRILNPGIDTASSQAVLDLAQVYPEVFAAVGMHPNSTQAWDASTESELRDLASRPKVVAIGEIGLDYYRDRSPQDTQKTAFRRQLHLAADLGLPVIIHNRQATADVLEILTEWSRHLVKSGSDLVERPGVLHSFSGDQKAAQAAMEMNFFLGFTGPVTFKNAHELQALVSHLPLDRILIETDAPFLAPDPLRGTRNEPALVRAIAGKIATLHACSVDRVVQATWQNAQRLFQW